MCVATELYLFLFPVTSNVRTHPQTSLETSLTPPHPHTPRESCPVL